MTSAKLESAVAPLFEPFELGGLKLRNRIVMAPMTRGMSEGGVPGPDVAEYYARRAAGGVGLIITEGTVIDHPTSSSRDDIPRFFGAESLVGWRAVVDAVHENGAAIVPQLWHVGWDPLHWGHEGDFGRELRYPSSPSGIDPSTKVSRNPMTQNDIADVIDGFASGARVAKQLGFDGIELHGAHGYLIDQFLWDVTNQRGDRYGGKSIADRLRFAQEIVAACRAAVGPEFPIIFRLSQWKVGHYGAKLAQDPGELATLVQPLAAAGVDIFHCSQRRFWQPEFEGSPLNLAAWVKDLSGRPAITVGSVGLADSDFLTYLDGGGASPSDVSDVCDRLAAGEFDLVAVGRALIADPNWPIRVLHGQATQAFEAQMLETLF